jgi:hypothetical protein
VCTSIPIREVGEEEVTPVAARKELVAAHMERLVVHTAPVAAARKELVAVHTERLVVRRENGWAGQGRWVSDHIEVGRIEQEGEQLDRREPGHMAVAHRLVAARSPLAGHSSPEGCWELAGRKRAEEHTEQGQVGRRRAELGEGSGKREQRLFPECSAPVEGVGLAAGVRGQELGQPPLGIWFHWNRPRWRSRCR